MLDNSDILLDGKNILITGSARRVGKILALAAARAGGNLIIHHSRSDQSAKETYNEIIAMGRQAKIVCSDLSNPTQVEELFSKASEFGMIDVLVNNAAIFEPVNIFTTTLDDWQRHMDINLTAPFLLSQALARTTLDGRSARIINILDWRALRPGVDHFPYTISKAALAAMTKSLAVTLAPNIIVNGLALGAILPPADQVEQPNILRNVPARRWAEPMELSQAFTFLLTCPAYITGEIIHLDGGRHLV
jgi:NAD(P)-dependent dehydrogenase (short-subunit alcohol dehydrogenase family)